MTLEPAPGETAVAPPVDPPPEPANVAEADVPTESPPELPGISAADLSARMDRLQALFHDKILTDNRMQSIIDRLHADLQKHQQGLALTLLKPLALDLIRLHDQIVTGLDAWRALGNAPAADDPLLPVVAELPEALREILDRYGFEAFAESGTAFNGARQQVLRTVPTEDPALNRQVESRLRPGFSFGDQVVRRELVAVYKATPRPLQ